MNRRDTILLAVVINAGLLAVLFSTAIVSDKDPMLDQSEVPTTLVEAAPQVPISESPTPVVAASEQPTREELDLLFNASNLPQQVQVETMPTETVQEFASPQPEENQSSSQESIVEVTVKKGDMLEKIAKAHGTTVSAIKKANQLKSESLKIGQVLKIPIKKEAQPVASAKPKKAKEAEVADAVYYTVKPGDSPWKIARQSNVSYEDILKLNKLDEEKARNLKAGDKIRIK